MSKGVFSHVTGEADSHRGGPRSYRESYDLGWYGRSATWSAKSFHRLWKRRLTVAAGPASVATATAAVRSTSVLELVAVVLARSGSPGPSSLGLSKVSIRADGYQAVVSTYESHSQGLALERGAVQLVNTSSGVVRRVHLDETEAPGLLWEMLSRIQGILQART